MDLSKQSKDHAHGQDTINSTLKREALRFLHEAIHSNNDLELMTIVFAGRIRHLFEGASV